METKGEVKVYETKFKQVLKENTSLKERVQAKENNEETKSKKRIQTPFYEPSLRMIRQKVNKGGQKLMHIQQSP